MTSRGRSSALATSAATGTPPRGRPRTTASRPLKGSSRAASWAPASTRSANTMAGGLLHASPAPRSRMPHLQHRAVGAPGPPMGRSAGWRPARRVLGWHATAARAVHTQRGSAATGSPERTMTSTDQMRRVTVVAAELFCIVGSCRHPRLGQRVEVRRWCTVRRGNSSHRRGRLLDLDAHLPGPPGLHRVAVPATQRLRGRTRRTGWLAAASNGAQRGVAARHPGRLGLGQRRRHRGPARRPSSCSSPGPRAGDRSWSASSSTAPSGSISAGSPSRRPQPRRRCRQLRRQPPASTTIRSSPWRWWRGWLSSVSSSRDSSAALAVGLALAWGLAWIAYGRFADEPRSTATAIAARRGGRGLLATAWYRQRGGAACPS